MRFITPRCPECGELPWGTNDTVPCVALLDEQPDGSFEHSGETEVFWDDQTNEADVFNAVSLICREGHTWISTYAAECEEVTR